MKTLDRIEAKRAEWRNAMVGKGHTPVMESDGLSAFVCDAPPHSGPGCAACGSSWCWHCYTLDAIPACPMAKGGALTVRSPKGAS